MTAESAVVLSVLVAFSMALVWGLLVVAAQIQCVDAARTGARAAARQDSSDAVVKVTRQAAPRGARVTVGRAGDQVRVAVVARPPVLSGLPFEVREEAVAVAEETVGAGTGVDTGTGAGTGAGTGNGSGADAGAATGTDAGSGNGTGDTGTGTRTGEGAGTDTGAGAGVGTDTGAAAGAGLGAGAVARSAREPAS